MVGVEALARAVAAFTLRRTMQFVLSGAAIGALVLGVAGFVFGASVPDERAGEAAALVAKIGAGVGALLGGALGAGLHVWMR